MVAERLRRARNEDDPPPVSVDVALEKGHLVRRSRVLDDPNEPIECLGCSFRALSRDDLVRPSESDEGDGRAPVLALQRPHFEQLCAEGGRHRDFKRDSLDVGERFDRAPDGRCGAKESAAVVFLAELLVSQECRGFGAQQDLARLRGCLHLHRPARRRPGDQELTVRAPHQEELEASGVQSRVHLQLDCAGGRLRAADRAQGAAHLERSACRASGVIVAGVEQEQRVAAELQQTATLRVRHGEQRGEGRIHDLGDLFGSCSTEAGEALRHRRKS